MFIEKGTPEPSTRPLTGGAVRRDSVLTTDGDGAQRKLNVASMAPGIVLDELNVGEKPMAFRPDGTDINFGVFEAAIVNAIA